MSQQRYRSFLSLLKRWPLDESKKGRDFGEVLRVIFARNFPQGELTDLKNLPEIDRVYQSLDRISKNFHCKKYSCDIKSTSLGYTPVECNAIISNESLENFNK